MIEGFILDVRFDKLTGRMISWIVDEDGVTHRFEDSWTCTVHVRGERHRLVVLSETCLLYTSPSPRDRQKSRMPSSA